MDLGVPTYGVNGGVGPAQGHGNIFDMFQSFLGHFWNPDRTGMFQNVDNNMDLVDKAFPGVSGQVQNVNNALNDPSNPLSNIFGQLFNKGQGQ
jgi:hypothetical protein